MEITEKDIFHVHTYRCGHARNVPDEEYVKKAASFGASSIWFTDHAPFPGDPFGARMRYEGLEEYISTLKGLKRRYKDIIDIHIGLEIEYFPSFDKSGYYKELKGNKDLEILLLGQHMAEIGKGEYSFSWDDDRLDEEEFIVLGNAETQGIESGYFDVVAHPDRIFRRQKKWSEGMRMMADMIIMSAGICGISLEKNASSRKHDREYWEEFWNIAENKTTTIQGLDAHSPEEIDQLF